MVSDPSELESQAFVVHPACYVDARSGTLVLMIAQQVLLVSHPVTFPVPRNKTKYSFSVCLEYVTKKSKNSQASL